VQGRRRRQGRTVQNYQVEALHASSAQQGLHIKKKKKKKKIPTLDSINGQSRAAATAQRRKWRPKTMRSDGTNKCRFSGGGQEGDWGHYQTSRRSSKKQTCKPWKSVKGLCPRWPVKGEHGETAQHEWRQSSWHTVQGSTKRALEEFGADDLQTPW